MRSSVRWLLFIMLASLLSSCTSLNRAPTNSVLGFEKAYPATFARVWRAVQLSISTHYSLAINQMESGAIETDWISMMDGYTPPYQKKTSSSGLRYKLILSLIKGKTTGGDTAIRVIVRKQMEKKPDFFSDPESFASDGSEEQSILYRVGRELVIEQAILKAQAIQKKEK